jgi:epidermal growth factor receptor substrate 15
VLFILLSSSLIAQTEAEMKTQADKLFDSEQYLEATSLYMRLLSLQPKEVSYNYRYGTCLLFNSDKKADAIKYLTFAVNNDPAIVPEAYYFLGKALHLNYQFNEAIKFYTKYNENKSKAKKQFDADREIQMCQNGKRLMTTISDIIVLDKKEISQDKFFRIYNLDNIGGSMLVTAEFQTKLDKKNNHIPLIHFPAKPSVIYYSSYGDNGNTGKDIYVRRRLPDGSWGMPQPLPGNVNTQFDEDFPYMHPDGNHLYFSSKGHNSMGGFDVFRSKYDPETNNFGPPENIDFAISSPDDDLFYIVDSLNQNAYFASARQSRDGLLNVYKVKVDRVPLQLSVIKGNFVSQIDPKIKRIDFEIRDYSNGELIGKFNSNEKAVYLITFPKGGKYEYIMNIEGSSREFRAIVSIPFLKEFKPLKQKIVHLEENGKEVVKIIDLFNEEVEDPQAVIAEVIRKRSDLNVNVQEFNLEDLEKDKKNKEILKEIGMGDLLLVEVSENLKDKVKAIQQAKLETEQLIGSVNAQVVRNAQDFARLEEQIKEKVAEANKAQNVENKYILLREADQLIRKQEDLKQQSRRMLNLTDSIQQVVKSSESAGKLQQLDNLATSFDQLYRGGKEKEALDYLSQNKELVLNALNDRSLELKQNLVDRSIKIDDQLRTLSKKIDDYNRELKELDIQIQVLENSKNTAKKKELEDIERRIQAKKEEVTLINEDKKKLELKVAVLDQDKFLVNQQIYMIEEAINSKSNLVANREAANKALKETEKTNTNTLNSYVQQQITEMEKNDPTLRDRIVVSSGMKGDNILAEHRTQQQRIQTNTKLTRQEQTEKLLNNAQRTKAELEARLRDVEKQLENNRADAALQREKQEIVKGLSDIVKEIDRHERELAAIKDPVAKVDRSSVEKMIDPNYSAKQQEIATNSSLSELERLQKQQELDQQYIAQIDEKISVNENRLKNDPANLNLQKEADILKNLRSDKQEELSTRENEIRTVQGSQITTPMDRNSVVTSIDPSYEQKRTELLQNKNLSATERLNKEQELDRQFVSLLAERLRQNETKLKNEPGNKQLSDQNKIIRELIAEKENAISQRQEEINSISAVAKVYQNENELITSLNPNYNSNVNTIQNNQQLSRKEQLERLQQEDEKLLELINERIEVLETKSDPTSQQELTMLRKIATDRKNVMDLRENQLIDLDKPSALSSEALVTQIDPKHAEDIKTIRENMKLSDAEKLKRTQVRDNELKTKLGQELTNNEKQLNADPSNETLKQRVETLNETIAVVESRIDERNQLINDQLSAARTPEQVQQRKAAMLNKAIADYEKKRDQLLSRTDEAATKELIALQQQLLEKLEVEKKSVEKVLAKDPFNKEALSDLQSVNELMSNARKLLEEQQQKASDPLVAQITNAEKEDLINEVLPSYRGTKEQLAQLLPNDSQRVNQELELEKELLNELNERLTADKSILANDPNNAILKREVAVLEEQLKETLTNVTDLERRVVNAAKVKEQFTSEELGEALNEISPTYAENIQSISANPALSPANRMNELIIADRLLLNELLDQLDVIDQQLLNDVNNQKLREQKVLLEQITERLEQQIDRREIEQKALEITPITSESLQRNQWVDRIDPSYKQDVRFIENNTALDDIRKLELLQQKDQVLIGKVQDRISSLESKPKPMAVDELAELAELYILKDQLLQIASDRSDMLANRVGGNQPVLTEAKLIEQLLPDYLVDKKNILDAENSSASQKQSELIRLEETLQQKAENRLEEIQRALAVNPDKTELIEEERMVQSILNESKKEQELLEKNEPIELVATETILAEVMPDYQSRKTEVTNSRMEESAKIDALLKLENELLTKLQSEEKRVNKLLAKDQTNSELKAQVAKVSEMIADQSRTIADLETRKSQLAAKLAAENTIRSIDKTYEQDVSRLSALPNEQEKYAALADREKKHQEVIAEQIQKNEQLLTKKTDTKLAAQNEILKIAQENSRQKEAENRAKSSGTSDVLAEQKAFVDVLREELIGTSPNEIEANHITLDELQVQYKVLAQYEEKLKQAITSTERALQLDPTSEILQKEVNWLNSELELVQQKRRSVAITIGELERTILATGADRKVQSAELDRLDRREEELKAQLEQSDLSVTQRKQLEKDLTSVEQAQLKEENTLLLNAAQNDLSASVSKTEQVKRSLGGNETDEMKVVLSQVNRENQRAEDLIDQAKKAKSETEKNYLVDQALQATEKSNALLDQAVYRNEIETLETANSIVSLETKGELEARKRRFTIEVGELSTEIIRLDRELGSASKKEVPAIEAKRAELVSERAALNREIQRIDEKLSELTVFTPTTVDPNALNTAVSASEEQQIAMSDEYRSYSEKANTALTTEREIRNLEEQLTNEKQVIRELALKQVEDPTTENKTKLNEAALRAKQLEDQINVQRNVLNQKQLVVKDALPQNTNEAMKMQNLISRGVEPISKAVVAVALLNLPAEGLNIVPDGAGVYSAENRIPIDVNTPSGLVYRVQVGAFAKPIAQDLFKEFNPISGEKLNSGITRYMAGYFTNEQKVMEARNAIRALGYADAFPVAYCDGKRVSLAEARQLVASGACVSKGNDQLMMEVAMNTVERIDLNNLPQNTGYSPLTIAELTAQNSANVDDTTRRKRPAIDVTYNQAPGAVKAEAIEMRKGLFFTVQIGVYNKPVTAGALNNLEPYFTLRLPNGQIRYSTGIFHSIDEARPRKQEAIDKGVKDAFITAYYNGERIPLGDAMKLLEEKGQGVLEPKVLKTGNDITTVSDPIVIPTDIKPISTGYTPVIEAKQKEYLQIVTKKQFTEFPTDVLNRYNSHGSFYFDESDRRVKSVIAFSDEDLPQVHYFKADIDTMRYSSSTEYVQGTILSFTFAEGALPGDVVDWLLRLNYRKEYLQNESGIVLFLHGIQQEKVEQLIAEAERFGITPVPLAAETEIRDYRNEK